MVAFDSPIDQHFIRTPRVLLEKPPEAAMVSIHNPNVFKPHVKCAAVEAPLAPWDMRYVFYTSRSIQQRIP